MGFNAIGNRADVQENRAIRVNCVIAETVVRNRFQPSRGVLVSLAQMSKFTNHRAISLFFCRAYFPPVYWARHKTHAEPKIGRSQNGKASNRENLPQSGLTLALAILDRIKG